MSDFYKVRETDSTLDLEEFERKQAEINAYAESIKRAARVKWVDTLKNDAKLIYRAAQLLNLEAPELRIDACIDLATAAAISDSLTNVARSIDNGGA